MMKVEVLLVFALVLWNSHLFICSSISLLRLSREQVSEEVLDNTDEARPHLTFDLHAAYNITVLLI